MQVIDEIAQDGPDDQRREQLQSAKRVEEGARVGRRRARDARLQPRHDEASPGGLLSRGCKGRNDGRTRARDEDDGDQDTDARVAALGSVEVDKTGDTAPNEAIPRRSSFGPC